MIIEERTCITCGKAYPYIKKYFPKCSIGGISGKKNCGDCIVRLLAGIHEENNRAVKAPKLPKTKPFNRSRRSRRNVPRVIRGIVLQRDNYKCTECGASYKLHVHHIKEKCVGGNDCLNNLTTLCTFCHANKHKDEPVFEAMKRDLKLV
jgi:5-methylcytosine-specific restriction endonuclease McrA